MHWCEGLEPRQLLHAGHGGFHLRVNFQPTGGAVPGGYVADVGYTFGLRGNGRTYGWDADNTAQTRQRNSARSNDLRYDTLTHLQPSGASRKWELQLPDGYYDVRVVAGDAGYFDSVYKINVENKLTVNGTPSSASPWVEGRSIVQVTDGRLSIAVASGARNAKLCFVDVMPADAPTTQPPPVAGGWTRAADMPIQRTEAQQAIKDDKLYVFGGFANGTWDATTRVDVFDARANTWTRLGDMPIKLTHSATVVDGNNVIFAGGFVGDDPGPATKDVWRYDIVSKAWSKMPSLPSARGGGGVGIVGTTLYFFGGGTRNASLQHDADYGNTWALDLTNTASGWKSKATMPVARNHLAFATLNGKIYAIGGQILNRENTGNQSVVHAFDPAANKWSSVASLPLPLGHNHAGTVTHNGRIIMAGGVTTGYKTTNTVLSYNPSTNKWTNVLTMPVYRKSVNQVIVNETLYVVGGGNNLGTREVYKIAWPHPA